MATPRPRIPLQLRVAALLARPALQPLWEWLYLLSLRGLGYNNPKEEINGENRFVREWLRNRHEPLTVFDVGANAGDFTGNFALHAQAPCEFHLFEPHPETFARLSARFPGQPNVALVRAGVGAQKGEMPLYDVQGQHGTVWASFRREAVTELLRKPPESARVEVITLDEYCERRGIERIDYLKIDTEGFEREVLMGACRLIEAHRIRTIQLEWNDIQTVSGFTLFQLTHLLPGFEIRRLLPNGTTLLVGNGRAYHTRYDIARYSNLVCTDPYLR